MIRTIIVEDDPMVAQINREYLYRLGDFQVTGVYSSGREALEAMHGRPADLAILDVYMPGVSGIELLRQMRAENIRTAVIMVTAATEMQVVEEALHLGIVDYLIKPFTFARFEEAARKYLAKAHLLKSTRQADQAVVDRLLSGSGPDRGDLQKGLNPRTLESVQDYLRQHPAEQHTCESLSEALSLSRVTVRRYLNYLIEVGRAASTTDYRTGGRPRVLYRLK